MVSTTAITLILVPVLLFALWHAPATFIPPVPLFLRNKRIILLIAHPDDESMFFSPTLQALTSPHLQNHLKILCMSTGDSEGLGATRRLELERAAVTLGVRRKEDVFVLDDARFRDGMQEDWKPEEVARVLASAFAPHLNGSSELEKEKEKEKDKDKDRRKSKSSKSSKSAASSGGAIPPPQSSEGPRATIDVLITFDSRGVSGHPNHKALYHGAREFVTQIMRGHSGYASPVALYTLPSINIVRKYSFIVDAIPTLLGGIYGSILGNAMGTRKATSRPAGASADRLVFVNDLARYWKAREAMIYGHKSQMVWFRWGWIGLGRYMVVNDLRSERIVAT